MVEVEVIGRCGLRTGLLVDMGTGIMVMPAGVLGVHRGSVGRLYSVCCFSFSPASVFR